MTTSPKTIHVYNLNMTIYIKCKFYEIGYLVMAKDGKMDRWFQRRKERQTNGQRQTYIPPPLAGDN